MHDEFSSLVERVEKQRAEKVARFLELLRDPDLATYVELLRNGDGHHVESGQGDQAALVPPVGFKTGNGIREAIRALALPARFTCDDVVAALEHGSFQFTASDHRKPVRDALYVLSHGKDPELRRVRGGTGGQVAVYEWNRLSG